MNIIDKLRYKKSIILNNINIIIGIVLLYLWYLDLGYKTYIYNIRKFLTNWTFILTIIYSVIKIIFKNQIVVLNILFNIILIVEILISSVFWILLYPHFDNSKYTNIFFYVTIIYFHIFPTIFVLIEFYINNKNIEIKTSYLKYTYLYLFIYLINNIYFSFIYNDAPYIILTCKDMLSLLLIVITVIIIGVIFKSLYFFDNIIKNNFLKKYN